MVIQWDMMVYLWLFNSLPWYRWPIEIDGLPNLKMGGFSMAMLNNRMVEDLGNWKHEGTTNHRNICQLCNGTILDHGTLKSGSSCKLSSKLPMAAVHCSDSRCCIPNLESGRRIKIGTSCDWKTRKGELGRSVHWFVLNWETTHIS